MEGLYMLRIYLDSSKDGVSQAIISVDYDEVKNKQ